MRNLILFIQRYYVFFVFLLLLALSVFILISNNRYQRTAFINSANSISGELFTVASDIRGYFFLKEQNEALHAENALLKSRMRDAYYVDTISSVDINDSVYKQRYTYLDAQVINNSVDRDYNFITLNRGSEHGVERNMGVVCDQGVVGIVVNVSDRFCTVMSVLNKNTKITPKIDTFMYFGSVVWNGQYTYRYVKLLEINQFAPVKEGMKVYTTGFSEYYPENVLIGTIEKVSLETGANFYDIDVRLSTDFTALRSVYIVKNLFKEEINKLEEETREGVEDGS